MLLVKDDPEAVEADLAAGRVSCPDCGEGLERWGFGSERELRTLRGVRRLRPRRAMCSSCRVTHVLEPSSTLPRLRDTAEVVGTAWQANVAGMGHRTIARRLTAPCPRCAAGCATGRPGRGATDGRHRAAPRLRPDGPIEPSGSPLADALEAVGQAAAAVGRQLGPCPPWEVAAALTRELITASPARRAGVKGGRQAVP